MSQTMNRDLAAVTTPAATNTASFDVDCTGFTRLVVLVKAAGNASAAADASAFVNVFDAAGAVFTGVVLGNLRTSSNLTGATATMIIVYDVQGIGKVRLTARNAHATLANDVTLDHFLS